MSEANTNHDPQNERIGEIARDDCVNTLSEELKSEEPYWYHLAVPIFSTQIGITQIADLTMFN